MDGNRDAGFPIEVETANPEHVRILTRDADGFDGMVRELLPPKTAEAALALKPYLFVKTNPSAEMVVAYCVHYDVAGAAGPAGQTFCYTENPTAVLTQTLVGSMHEEPLRPGGRRVAAFSARFDHRRERDDPYWIAWYRAHLEEQYPRAFVKHMRISLDAVILSDGTLYGPAGAGHPLAGTMEALREERERLRAGDPGLGHDGYFYTVQSISEADSLWRRTGDEAFVRLAREMAEAKPFTVRRGSFRE